MMTTDTNNESTAATLVVKITMMNRLHNSGATAAQWRGRRQQLLSCDDRMATRILRQSTSCQLRSKGGGIGNSCCCAALQQQQWNGDFGGIQSATLMTITGCLLLRRVAGNGC